MNSKLLLCALALMLGASPLAARAGTVLMIVPDGSRDLALMLEAEVGVMRSMLAEAGHSVEIATATDAPMAAGDELLTPTVMLADVDVADYDGILLPCMAPAPGTAQPDAIDAIVAEAHRRGLPLAASRGSVAFLARAGALDDRVYTSANGYFLGTTVASSDGVSTAGICPLAARSLGEPDGTRALTQSFLRSLEVGG